MKKSKRTGKPHCVIQRGNVKVPVYKRTTKKRYIEYQVPDHTSGKRKLLSFADEAEAKHKATEIAEAAAHGDHDLLSLAGYKHRILSAIEWLMPTGLQIDDACHLIFDASEIINLKQLLDACRFYKKHQPDKPFTPKLVTDAVREYQAMPHKLGWKRIKTFNGYLNVFSRQFSEIMLHDVDEVALKDFVDSKQWSPKSYNEFLRGLSIFYRAAQFRRWVPTACDPAVKIKRRKEVAAQVDIFQPPEVKRLLACLSAVAPELVPTIAIWCFSGVRLEEIGRVTWSQVNNGLRTGKLVLAARQTKTGRERSIKILPNLMLWLQRFNQEHGSVIPNRWLTATKTAENRLSELPRFIRKKTGSRWADNWGRHSFGTFYFKLTKDPGEVVRQMGNNLKDFERNYWNKADSVTDEAATEFFGIVPEDQANVVSLPVIGSDIQAGDSKSKAPDLLSTSKP